ncbi:32589_t:CDS:2 [Gigaspora margarita]|uniref:32589_t:CDS:1 n=1 Tax=Gigaspora margarita TaxID=4874 RepID=A0ABN7V676_GIGMA|nr:32589_t:CDS:2 [Gigaspora margarita]
MVTSDTIKTDERYKRTYTKLTNKSADQVVDKSISTFKITRLCIAILIEKKLSNLK